MVRHQHVHRSPGQVLHVGVEDFRALRCKRLTVAYGEQEQTADVPAFLAALYAQGLSPTVLAFPASAHNLFDDVDAEAEYAAWKLRER